MKLTILVFLISTFSLLAGESYSQDTRVSLNLKNVAIKEVLLQIENSSEFFFIYNNQLIDVDRNVSVSANNEKIKDVLNDVFKDQKVEFEVADRKIVIVPTSVQKSPSQVKVSGNVTDATGMAIPGVSVVVKGTTNGTITDEAGHYTISNIPENATLQFSFVGMKSQEIKVGTQSEINVKLDEETVGIEEVVAIGYGTQKKKDLSGSVTRANLNTTKESPNVSIGSALQGTIAGLNVGAVTRAGADPEITIRGRTSISGTQTPLIVLDGIIYRGSLVDINPGDIESIDVLKDASATAIYGSQASNGVILITSKIGKIVKKPTIQYDFSYTTQDITNKKMLPEDADGFVRRIGDRFLSESRTGADMLTPNPSFDPTSKFYGPEVVTGYQNKTNTNWWDLMTNKNPAIQSHNMSITGKNELSSYFFSVGYTDQDNVVINDSYKRYSYRVNLDAKVTDWMKVGIQSFLTVSNYSGASPAIGDLMRFSPLVPSQDANGKAIVLPYRGFLNPLLQIDQQDLERRNNLFANLFADINVPFIKGLNYRLNFSQNELASKHYNFNPYAQNLTGEGYKNNGTDYSYTVDNIFTYTRKFGEHAFNNTFVYGIEKRQGEGSEEKAIKFGNNSLGYNNLGVGQAGLQTATSSAWQESSLYAMLRLGYTYKDRYIFTGTVRRDGFSGFGQNNKFGVFPSAAFAWRIGDEKFIRENLSIVDDWKLRVSYGLSGNRTIGRYKTLAKIDSNIGLGYLYGDGASGELGQKILSLANADLKWETTKSFNFGTDFSLLKNRLSGSIEYYRSNTYNLLYDVNIPVLNGLNTIPMNIGKLKNSGIEITITGTPVKMKDFSWDITGNFSMNRNKVVSILGIDANKDGVEDDLVSSKIFINKPYGVAYDFNTVGMWQIADAQAGKIPAGFTYGTYKIEDVDQKDGITAAGDRKILGYTDPGYRFSIQNAFKYKNWELKVFINSIQGGKNYYYGQPGSALDNPDNITGWNLFKYDYWTPENPNARYRQIGYAPAAIGSTYSPYVQRSFVRLQDVTLSYSVPKALLSKMKINRMKLFVNGKNLYTWTNWDGWDPETGSGLDVYAYPLLRNFSFGFNVEF